MTICIAAICEESSMVIGVSDRMLTVGDIQFEPEQRKQWQITDSVAGLTAGDSGVHDEIMQKITLGINPRITVSEVAERYRDAYEALVARRSQTEILAPFNLTHKSFLAMPKEDLALEQREILSAMLKTFEAFPERVDVVLLGVDKNGPHIYTVCNGDILCHDTFGFAAIGAGGGHAESQLMFFKYGPDTPYSDALLLVYSAKKHAEVAPGVGKETDIILIGPGRGSLRSLPENTFDELGRVHQSLSKHNERALQRSQRKFAEFLRKGKPQDLDRQ